MTTTPDLAGRALSRLDPSTTGMAYIPPSRARALFRKGTVSPTAGWSAGFTQANLIAVPSDWAYDVLLFAQRNPRACPVLDVTDPGSVRSPLAPDADLRTDLPAYRVWRDGELVDEPADVRRYWRPDLVAFLIGCSFTFETALREAGVPLRHVEEGRNVPMYVTTRPCRSAGRLRGPIVMSMRPIPSELVATAVRVTAAMPGVHGAPLHVGDPSGLGITDLDRPDFGDAVTIRPGEVPVFWGCGTTPQAAIMTSRPPFAITHAPGHMLVTDVPDATYRYD
ncbi:putative hydro-lyase [Actinopolymorpha alba]|uniref:putative hydro-lyase n=1 Tax=Actinopolymorpha alba TaxID=533267 RepID=UPI00037311C3|nr:putative hydro-lyase [Actinopolymorpha alba]